MMSGLISQPFINELLRQTDLVELIDAYVPLKKRGTAYIACCPFHNEKSPSFNVVAKKQFYHCFGCGASGNAISFMMNYLNQGFTDAVETLALRLGLTVVREGPEKNNSSQALYHLLQEVNLYYQKQLKTQGQNAITYLKNRGLSGAIAKQYQLGYAPQGWHQLEKAFPKKQHELLATGMLIKNDDGKLYDRYRDRVMFPIHDRQGRIVGFGGRALDALQKPKYLNSPETALFQKSKELYGLYQMLNLKKQPELIVVVEGYMDVIALAQHGIANAVATLGTATNSYHIQVLAKHTQQLIFCFDGDAAGKQAAWRALESSLPHLNSGLEVSFAFLPEGHDPDSFVREQGAAQFLTQMTQALPLHRFLLDSLSKDLKLTSPSGKTQLIHNVKPLLQKMTEGSYKQLLIEDLARITHIESHRLSQMVHPQDKIQAQNNSILRTPLRIALALLLQNPEIYSFTKELINLKLLDDTEHYILIQLLQKLATNPDTNTAALIESWRSSAHFETINQLAAWDHKVPDHNLVTEFTDTLLFLQKQNQALIIQRYIDKSRHSGLNETEKLELQQLLKAMHDLA